MMNYTARFEFIMYRFEFNHSIGFKSYHCVQMQAAYPWNTIATWKISKLKKPK